MRNNVININIVIYWFLKLEKYILKLRVYKILRLIHFMT